MQSYRIPGATHTRLLTAPGLEPAPQVPVAHWIRRLLREPQDALIVEVEMKHHVVGVVLDVAVGPDLTLHARKVGRLRGPAEIDQDIVACPLVDFLAIELTRL